MRLHISVLIVLAVLLANGGRASAAPIPVVLNFDSNGANSFLNAIDAAADGVGLGAAYFPAGDVAGIKTAIQNELTNVYNGFNIQFTTAPTAGARTETFADPAGNVFGLAPFNWRNAFLPNTSSPANDAAITAQIFSSNFGPSLSTAAGTTVAQNEARLAIGIADTGAHELGHTFGLDHQDDYGDPRITPANYANTLGIQNTHIMASGVSGLGNDRSTPRQFSQLELAKLAQSNNVYVANGFTPNLAPDAGDTHTQLSTAGANASQPLNFKFVQIAGESVVTVTGGTIGTAGIHDVYSFLGGAGSLLTADILAFSAPFEDDVATGKFFNTPANTLLTLWRLNGGNPQVVAFSSDKQYSGNKWLSGVETDADPMILNQPLPVTDTYFLDVQGVSTGNYEMFVSAAVPEASTWLLLGSGLLALAFARRKLAATETG